MADIPPSNPAPTPAPGSPVQSLKTETGAVQPPKKETGKVQPKKETVRINLPPRPTAAPTIKLPTLPPGGPTGASSPSLSTTPPAAAGLKTAAAAAAPAKTAATTQRPAAAQVVPAIQPVDKILIYAAAVTSLIAVGIAVWVLVTLKNVVEKVTS
ncbi:MAG: hypothetical protein WCJ07_11275 [Verrucomicrobiota bacterium]